MAPAVGMKQVGQLFDETLAAIRDNAPGIDALEPEAIAWLKSARREIMRGILIFFFSSIPYSLDIYHKFIRYYELDRSRNCPMSHPTWVNPSSSLFLTTGPVPTLLYPYGNAFRDNLATLIQDCGFSKSSASNNTTFISVRIYFPVSSVWRRSSRPPRPEFCMWRTNFRAWEEKGRREDFLRPLLGAF
ncbi:hypothetical protein C8J57DRAFT_1330966 [Mycena rebaudengoi]|nr:hypothetical protein C8J57DRAFT_1330966 [Mycena rebaudengoi]